MIKKLKMRFVLVNMMILSLVLFTTLSSIYVLMSNSEIKMSNEIMDTLIENHKKTPPNKNGKPHSNLEYPISFKNKTDYNKSVLVYLDDKKDLSPYGNDKGWENYWNQWEGKDPFNPWNPENWGNGNNEEWWFKPPEMPYMTMPPENNTTEPVEPDISEIPPETMPLETAPPETEIPEIIAPPIETQPEEIIIPETPVPEETDVAETLPPQTEEILTETQESLQEEITQTLTPETYPPDIPREPKPEITTKYNGNLVRSHIFAEIGRNKEILDVSFQYFFQYDDESIENQNEYSEKVKYAIENIINSNKLEGKYEIENISYRYKMNFDENDGMYSLVLLDRSIEISTLNRLLITFIIIGCIGLIAVFFISLFLANWAIKPIEAAWIKQKQFIADASHEMKTPLTIISANTDVVLSTPFELIKNQERWLKYIKSETARMSKLVNELLYIAKSDSNEIKMDMSEFDISNTISGVCLMFESLAFEAGKELVSDITPRIKYFGDEDRIKQLITILIDNSIKYSIMGSQISASFFRNNQGRIKFCISNKCEDMTEKNISRLFDRFYRVDSSRNSETGGNGLGLNIAQTIAEAHKGTVTVNYHYGIISFIVTL